MSGRMTEANLEQYKPTVFEQIITLREGDDTRPVCRMTNAQIRAYEQTFGIKWDTSK